MLIEENKNAYEYVKSTAKHTCKYCGKEMIKDDIDFQFKGCYDIYWLCDCGASCIEKVRYSKTCKVDWNKEQL